MDRLQTPAVMRPHKTLVGPPDGNAKDKLAAYNAAMSLIVPKAQQAVKKDTRPTSAVQLLRMAKANPSMDKGEKCLLSSGAWPSAARYSSSLTLARRSIALVVVMAGMSV